MLLHYSLYHATKVRHPPDKIRMIDPEDRSEPGQEGHDLIVGLSGEGRKYRHGEEEIYMLLHRSEERSMISASFSPKQRKKRRCSPRLVLDLFHVNHISFDLPNRAPCTSTQGS